jgi:DNA-binding LacI/PurR family transcriptional regulator/signal transduction histidine kinase
VLAADQAPRHADRFLDPLLAAHPPHRTAAGAAGARKTVAVLIDHLDHLSAGYEFNLRGAFVAACREHDLNLLVFVGRGIGDPDGWGVSQNRVYQLAHPDCVDGVILVSPGLATFCGEEGLRRLCESYRPLPLCSIGLAVPGVPSIVCDHVPGMEEVIEHLIREHGCRRLALVCGPETNPHARERLEAYRRVLARHELPYDPQLVGFGEFVIPAGRAVTDTLLGRGARFDALVAANDAMALGAIEALEARGVRVPRDVCVTGFDDLDLARLSSPPLTTVRQPLERLATLAVEAIVDQIAGKPVPECTSLPVALVTRKSCGCGFRRESHPPRRLPDAAPPPPEFVRQNAERLACSVADLVRVPGAKSADDATYLVRALRAELEGHQDAFILALEDLLEQYGQHNELFEELQAAVTLLRDEVGGAKAVDLEGLWHGARCTIASANTRAQAQQRLSMDATYLSLLRCGERFSSARDLASLRRALAEELSGMQVNEAVVCLCADDCDGELEPFFCMRDGVAYDPPAAAVAATQLLSRGAYCDDRRHTAFVLPLTFEAETLGVAVFEFGPSIRVYEMLRAQISVALKNRAFRAEIVHQTMLRERSVQERLAATERMKSLSALAGGVAHDLNSTIAPLVALPDYVLRGLDELANGPLSDVRRLRTHVEMIKAGALSATETIRDLMTLGRQGNVQKTRVDINRAVASCLAGEARLVAGQLDRRAELALRLHPEPLFVQASQHHLERAISNLVRNAVEAIDDTGTISVSTSQVRLAEPVSGYETVAPGHYAVVTVSDTGPGMAAEHISRAFEPFFSNKQLGDRSGSGLGLSIVLGVVKEHDGFVDLQSEPGQGTTFALYFALAVESPAGERV